MNRKNIIKGGLILVSVYGIGELMYQVGKGRMLGVLSHYNMTAETAKTTIAATRNHYPENVIMSICDISEKTLSKENGAV